jgi:hypothetical protein
MKKFVKIFRGAGALLFAAALATACSNPLDAPAPQDYSSAPQNSSGTGTAVIRISNGVKGIFSWNITLPEGLSSAELRLGDAAPVNLLTAAAGSVEVAAGTYNLFITMTKGGLNAGLYEWVYIYPGLESPAAFNFAGGADALAFTDTVLLAGTVNASIPAGVIRPFTVKAYSDAACTNDITASGSTTIIAANGGTWLLKIPASYIGQNVYLKATPAGAVGHTPSPGTANITALPSNGQAGFALNIDVQVGITLDYLAEYLAGLPVGLASVPNTIPLAASVVIDTSDASSSGVWVTVNSTVQSTGKYVILDLSACTATGNTVSGASSPTLNQMNIIKNNQYVKGIILPDNNNTLTSIGNYAFQNCTGLTSVIIQNGVTSIGRQSFLGCNGLRCYQ